MSQLREANSARNSPTVQVSGEDRSHLIAHQPMPTHMPRNVPPHSFLLHGGAWDQMSRARAAHDPPPPPQGHFCPEPSPARLAARPPLSTCRVLSALQLDTSAALLPLAPDTQPPRASSCQALLARPTDAGKP